MAGGARGDVVVLRRSKTSLDQLEGVFHDVTEEAVDFEYDEQRIAVKRAKLEGHRLLSRRAAAICRIRRAKCWKPAVPLWRAKSLELAGDQLRRDHDRGGTNCDIPVQRTGAAAISRPAT